MISIHKCSKGLWYCLFGRNYCFILILPQKICYNKLVTYTKHLNGFVIRFTSEKQKTEIRLDRISTKIIHYPSTPKPNTEEPMFTITIGRENTACPSLSERIYDEISEAVRRGKTNLYLVVNQAATFESEGNLMDRFRVNGIINHLGAEGFVDVEVISFTRLVARVLSLAGGAGLRALDDHGRQMLVARCLSEEKKQLTHYKKSVGRPGFLADITQMIGELKEDDIAPETLESVREGDEVDRLLARKLKDVQTVYAAYERALGDERFDEVDRVNEAVRKIETRRLFEGATFWIDGFFTFSASEKKLIEAIAARAADVNVSLNADIAPNVPDAQVFAPCVRTVNELSAIASRTGNPLSINEIPTPRGENKQPTAFFADALYAYNDPVYPDKPRGIELHACQNLWDEATAAAETITALARDRNIPFGEMAVMVGDMETMGGVIARVLAQYAIPCFTDQTDPVSDHPLIETVVAALRVASGRIKREDIFAYLSAGFAPVTEAEAADLKNYAITRGVRDGQWFRPFEREGDDVDLAVLNRLRERAMTPLADLRAVIGKKSDYRACLTALFAFLEAVDADGTLTRMAERAEALGFLDARLRDLQIWNILMKAMDQTESALGDTPCDGKAFYNVFVGGLSGYRVGVIPENDDAVLIGDVVRSHAERVRALFVLGANEGILPGAKHRFAVFSDRERQKLGQLGIVLHDNSAYLREREAYAIYRRFAGVSDFLFLSYASAGEEGALLPSFIAERLRAVFPKARIKTHFEGTAYNETRWITPTAGTLNALADAEALGLKDRVAPVAEALAERGIIPAKIDTTRRDTLSPGVADALYGKSPRVSVSRVEGYFACPFAYFANYGIRPQAILPFDVSPPTVGNAVHAVLDLAFKRAQAAGTPPETLDEGAMADVVASAVEDVFSRPEYRVFGLRDAFRYRRERVTDTIRVSAEMIRRHLAEGKFAYYASEKGFSETVEAPETGETFRVSGIIDRVDTFETDDALYLKIIDYKTGSKKINLTDIYYGLALQLLFYLAECEEMLAAEAAGKTVVPGGAFYFHPDNPMVGVASGQDDGAAERDKCFKMDGVYLADDTFKQAMSSEGKTAVYAAGARDKQVSLTELRQLIAYVRLAIIRGAEAMGGGDIRVAPYLKSDGSMPCAYCQNRGLCGFDELIDGDRVRVMETRSKKDIMAAIADIVGTPETGEEAPDEMDS